MYSGDLPERLCRLCDANTKQATAISLSAYKAADQLMMFELQNHIVSNEIARMTISDKPTLSMVSLLGMWELDLSHTPYYQMVLKSCVRDLVTSPECETTLTGNLTVLANHTQALTDIILCMNQYNKKPCRVSYRCCSGESQCCGRVSSTAPTRIYASDPCDGFP